EGRLAAINPAVDAANAVSLHSGMPISVVDLERVRGSLRVQVAEAGASYVFNQSGQEIDVAGLPCLWDQDGPCANAVKDAQRSKTDGRTRAVLVLVWGCQRPQATLPSRTMAWLSRLLAELGVAVVRVPILPG